MDVLLEQRICIKFCVKLKKTPTETFKMLKEAFNNDAMSQSRTFEWHSRFRYGRISTEDDEREGRPVTQRIPENVEKIKELIKENARTTIREISETTNLSFGLCRTIIKDDLKLRRAPAKFVPHLLTSQQAEQRLECCQNMLENFITDPLWTRNVITGDECWVYGYDAETK